jgi:uncharacterized protein (TIGR00369 family)
VKTTPTPQSIFMRGGPEVLFAVDGLTRDDDGIRAHMATGPWTSGAGSIGILADNVLGYALISRAPEDRWSVSTEITLDFLRPLPQDGTRLLAEGRTVHAGGSTGLAEGSIFDEGGHLVARTRQWGRYVATPPDGDGAGQRAPVVRRTAAALLATVRRKVTRGEGLAELVLDIEDDLVNPLTTLHGGVTLWVTELLASEAVSTVAPALRPASVTVSYLRPFPLGDVAVFRAEVESRGRRLATTRLTGTNRAGKRCVTATVHHHGHS